MRKFPCARGFQNGIESGWFLPGRMPRRGQDQTQHPQQQEQLLQ